MIDVAEECAIRRLIVDVLRLISNAFEKTSRLQSRAMNQHSLTYELYTLAFQNPAKDVSMLVDAFTKQLKLCPVVLREDFWGSFANCREWINSHPQNVAIGIDIDPEFAGFAHATRLMMPKDESDRFSHILGDVLDVALPSAHIVAALNSSFCVFKKRPQFKDYLRKCFQSFDATGMMALEVYCGADSQNIGCDEIEIGGHTAIWEQAKYDPTTSYCLNYIHFRLEDGTLIERAFEYDWRLWSPAECVDLLEEVGFEDICTVNKSRTEGGSQVDTSQTLFILGFKRN